MSAVSVPELLRRGSLAPAHVSAVEAVMGEDWAHLELGRGSAVRLPADEGRRAGARRRAAVGGVHVAKAVGRRPAVKAKNNGFGTTHGSRNGVMGDAKKTPHRPIGSSEP